MADKIVKQRSYYVYVLFRHDTAEPFYVGKGFGDRWAVHQALSRHDKNEYKKRIIRQALAAGAEIPKIKVADGLTEQEAFELERAFIRSIGRWTDGGPLVNMSDGGEGQTGYRHTEQTKLLIGAASKNQVATPLVIARAKEMGLANKGKTMPPQVLAAVLKANVGRRQTKETRDKIGAGNRGKIVSAEARINIGRSSWGRVHSAETRAKISASSGKRVFPDDYSPAFVARARSSENPPVSDETRARISASKKGTTLSDERKAEISDQLRNRPPISDETREKLSAWQIGRKRSEEDKQKMRDGWARRNASLLAGKREISKE